MDDYHAFKARFVDTGDVVAPGQWASAEVIRTGRPVLDQVIEIERFDGARAAVLNSGAPIHDADGRLAGAVVAVQDVTALRCAAPRRSCASPTAGRASSSPSCRTNSGTRWRRSAARFRY